MEFLDKLSPLSRLISEWTQLKAEWVGIESHGINSVIILVELLIQSNWGEHPIAQEYVQDQEKTKYSNNLALLEVGDYWKGKSNNFNGKQYRAYRDWRTFAVDYSDYLTLSRSFDDVLMETDFLEQMRLFSLTKPEPEYYNGYMLDITREIQGLWQGKNQR